MKLVSQMTDAEWETYSKKLAKDLREEAQIDALMAHMHVYDEEPEDEEEGDDYERHMRFECRQGNFI